MKFCKHDGCERQYDPSKWENIRKQDEGWFFQKNGDSWCPDHVPEWVEGWRAKRASGTPPEPWRRGIENMAPNDYGNEDGGWSSPDDPDGYSPP